MGCASSKQNVFEATPHFEISAADRSNHLNDLQNLFKAHPMYSMSRQIGTVKIDLAATWGVWEGWSASLEMFRNGIGGNDTLANLAFSMHTVSFQNKRLPGLGLNKANVHALTEYSDRNRSGYDMAFNICKEINLLHKMAWRYGQLVDSTAGSGMLHGDKYIEHRDVTLDGKVLSVMLEGSTVQTFEIEEVDRAMD